VYTPPLVFLNAKQTVIRTQTSFSSHRIMCHEAELTTMIEQANNNEEIKLRQTIRLKTPCDYAFTTRGDFGNKGIVDSMQIAEYLHNDPVFQAKNLTVWILHIELTVKQRPRTTPMRAIGGIANYAINPNLFRRHR
jgi:hypothetical protein